MRWILQLQELSFEVRHKAGLANGDADGISRLTGLPAHEQVEDWMRCAHSWPRSESAARDLSRLSYNTANGSQAGI